jgi:TonB family protein
MTESIIRFQRLLRKWLDGSLRARDERSLRDTVQADQDLYDAMEGYTKHPETDHQAALTRLQERLKLPDSNKVAPPPAHQMRVTRRILFAAASIVLLIGFWWMMPSNINESSNQQTATSVPQTDTATESTLMAQAADDTILGKQSSVPGDAIAQNEAIVAHHSAPTPYPKSSKMSEQPAMPTEQVTEDRAKAANSVITDDAIAAAADNESKTEPTRAKVAEVAPLSHPQPTVKPQQPSSASTGARKSMPATAPAKDSPYFETDKKPSTEPKEDLMLKPADGWESFENYIRDHLVYPKDAAERRITGSVRIMFWVDQEGKPSQIRVVRALGYGCDEEAIRLLIEGPLWSPAGARDGAVEVRFPR